MVSRFSILADLIRGPKADAKQPGERQQAREEREAYRRQSREDMAYGRRTFLEQQAKQAADADPQAEYEAFCKAQALRIVQAGARARGLPVPTRLMQDESPEYPPGEQKPGDPSEGDDTSDQPKKGKKRAKPAKIVGDDDDENGEQPVEEETEAQYQERCRVTAAKIVAAGRRARGLDP